MILEPENAPSEPPTLRLTPESETVPFTRLSAWRLPPQPFLGSRNNMQAASYQRIHPICEAVLS